MIWRFDWQRQLVSYGKVKDTFWTSKKVRSFSDDAKLLALYFISGPHRNILGCMMIPDGYIMADLGWASERLRDAIATLSKKAFIVRDDDGWTLILGQLEHDPLGNPNHARAAIRLADAVPKDSIVFQRLVPILKGNLKDIPRAPQWHTDAIPDAIATPEPAPEPEPSVAKATGADAPLAEDAPSDQDLVWGDGLRWLSTAAGKPASTLRSLVGRWCKAYGAALVLTVLNEARAQSPPISGPIAWIEAALKTRSEGRVETSEAESERSAERVKAVVARLNRGSAQDLGRGA